MQRLRPQTHALLVLAPVLMLGGSACAGTAGATPTNAPVAAASSSPVRGPAPAPSPSPVRTATPVRISGPSFILIRAPDITAGARLNFQGQGFEPGEQTTVTIEDARGAAEAPLDPVI